MDLEEKAIRSITGNLSEQEEVEFQRWLEKHPDELMKFHEMKGLWGEAGALKPKAGLPNEVRWNRLETEMNKSVITRQRVVWGIAASFFLAAVVYIFLIPKKSTEIRTVLASNDGQEVILPDESKVTMAKGSSLSYPSNFGSTRSVNFTGQGFFEISEAPEAFVIQAQLGVVRVLGTTFNVKETNKKIQVVCLTGCVEVADDQFGSRKQILRAGMRSVKALKSAFSYPITLTNPESAKSWISGNNSYQDEPLKSVINDMENLYQIEITLPPSLDTLLFNGLIPRNDLDTSLEIITLSTSTSLALDSEGNYLLQKN